jgi:broad specificity phosphatase PhoE
VPRAILTLVRHGQTRANIDGVWHGSIDSPLTELGREQARRVAAYVAAAHPDTRAVFASPLRRAVDTASAIAGALASELRLEEALTEYHLGDWEGRSYRDLHRLERMWERMAGDADFAPPRGESSRQVATRIEGALRRIAADPAGGRVLVVSHGGALALALGWLLDGRPGWQRVVDNCSVSELVLEPTPELLSFNRTEHLGDAAEGRGAGDTIVSRVRQRGLVV